MGRLLKIKNKLISLFITKEHSQKMNVEDISITDKIYKKNKKAYKYAIDMLKSELYQSVEALYHNLNSLQLSVAA